MRDKLRPILPWAKAAGQTGHADAQPAVRHRQALGRVAEDPRTHLHVGDIADGTALGVQGTPTFFINDELIKPESYDDLSSALESAIRQ